MPRESRVYGHLPRLRVPRLSPGLRETLNAETMTADALQGLMRHKSYQTTQKYINLANQVNRAVEGLHVPEILQRRGA